MVVWLPRGLTGSSPRVRGTQPRRGSKFKLARFIPASAGNAPHASATCSNAAVHPRECGERCRMISAASASVGSSPRVRGTRTPLSGHPHVRRFIPASAGNAPTHRTIHPSMMVHPRECGERISQQVSQHVLIGSSPRVRGTPLALLNRRRGQRFIPASAGNARLIGHLLRRRPVHPRECGERAASSPALYSTIGSSPRVRGTHKRLKQGLVHGRFIPASAGNAAIAVLVQVVGPVHPRECGERLPNSASPSLAAGSSPRVRGTPRRAMRRLPRLRFIPASAGNAAGRARAGPAGTVHPRECGERDMYGAFGIQPQRFIPASAGNARPGAA